MIATRLDAYPAIPTNRAAIIAPHQDHLRVITRTGVWLIPHGIPFAIDEKGEIILLVQ